MLVFTLLCACVDPCAVLARAKQEQRHHLEGKEEEDMSFSFLDEVWVWVLQCVRL